MRCKNRADLRNIESDNAKRRETTCGDARGASPFPSMRGLADECGEHREVLRITRPSSDFDDHLASCVSPFDVGQGFRGRSERKDPIYNGTYGTGIYKAAEFA